MLINKVLTTHIVVFVLDKSVKLITYINNASVAQLFQKLTKEKSVKSLLARRKHMFPKWETYRLNGQS